MLAIWLQIGFHESKGFALLISEIPFVGEKLASLLDLNPNDMDQEVFLGVRTCFPSRYSSSSFSRTACFQMTVSRMHRSYHQRRRSTKGTGIADSCNLMPDEYLISSPSLTRCMLPKRPLTSRYQVISSLASYQLLPKSSRGCRRRLVARSSSKLTATATRSAICIRLSM